MTPLKTKIEAAKEKYLRNPYRRQGNQELEHKEIIDIRIEVIIDYIGLLEEFLTDILDKHQSKLDKLDMQPKKKEKLC